MKPLLIPVRICSYDHLLKADLETALDEHMRANQTRLTRDATLEPYFKRIASSPIKRESGGLFTSGDEVKKPRARRPTKAREELEQQPQYVPFPVFDRVSIHTPLPKNRATP